VLGLEIVPLPDISLTKKHPVGPVSEAATTSARLSGANTFGAPWTFANIEQQGRLQRQTLFS
jgi:hypothetical protein